jgi:hypothetical protein
VLNLIYLFLLNSIKNSVYIYYFINNSSSKKLNKITKIVKTVVILVIKNIRILSLEFNNSLE